MKREQLIRKYAKMYHIPLLALKAAVEGKKFIKPIARSMAIHLANSEERKINLERAKNWEF